MLLLKKCIMGGKLKQNRIKNRHHNGTIAALLEKKFKKGHVFEEVFWGKKRQKSGAVYRF